MLEQELYTNEKLREIEARPVVLSRAAPPQPGKPVLATVARPVGRALHRVGHRLETWATPPPEAEPTSMQLRGKPR